MSTWPVAASWATAGTSPPALSKSISIRGGLSVSNQAKHFGRLQLFAAVQERQLDQEQEAASLGGGDGVNGQAVIVHGQAVDGVTERQRVGEQRRDVLELNPRLGEVGNVADVRLQVDHGSPHGMSV